MSSHISADLQRRQTAGFVRWEEPGEPVAVHFHVNAIELLERDAIRAGAKTTAGILLGKRRDDAGRPAFVVENYEPVPVPTWQTSDSPFGDRRQLSALIDRWRARPSKRMMVLGFYRSCPEGEASLNEDDLSVLNVSPAESEALFLFIETSSGRPSKGRLFMAKNGTANWEWNLVPFSRLHISDRERPSAVKEPAPQKSAVENARLPKEALEESVVLENEEPQRSEVWLPGRWQWVAFAVVLLLALIVGFYRLRAIFLHFFGVAD